MEEVDPGVVIVAAVEAVQQSEAVAVLSVFLPAYGDAILELPPMGEYCVVGAPSYPFDGQI